MYEIRQGRPGEADITFYGGNRDFMRCKEAEAIVAGPAETGKTIAALFKLHILACKYPRSSLVIARKTQSSMYSTVLVTFQKKVLDDGAPVVAYGGEKPQWFDYANGSRIWMAGLDKSSKVLSSEHDVIYVNQAEELSLADWETLTTRTTGRAGNMPYSQTIGDCNPAGSLHWIVERSKDGALALFKSYHKDNPVLFDPLTGEITEQGERTLTTLGGLTGHRRKRLLEGEWASPEGIVYDMFGEENVSELAEYDPARGPVELGVDDGYSNNPRVFLFIQVDDDGVINCFDEMFHVKHLAATCIGEAQEKLKGYAGDAERFEIAICDPSAAQLIASFRVADIVARGAKCGVIEGIQNLERFVCDGGGHRLDL
jgi:phage terminase large subunit